MTTISPIFWLIEPGPREHWLPGFSSAAEDIMRSFSLRLALLLVGAIHCASVFAHDRAGHHEVSSHGRVTVHTHSHKHDGITHEHTHGADESGAVDTDLSVRDHLAQFRASGDERHLDIAWSQISPSLSDAADSQVLIDAATIAQAQHRFDTALTLVDRALQQRPFDRQAWLLKASIDLVGARTDSAAEACAQLRNVATLVVVTCKARVAVASGRSASALRTLSALLRVIDTASLDPAVVAWTLSVAGDAAAPTAPRQAVQFYRESVMLSESTQVRAALVDVLLGLHDLAAAEDELAGAGGGLALEVRRLIVAVQGQRSIAVIDDIDRLDRQFRQWIAQKDFQHAREMARFYLDVIEQPALARQLAAINYEAQREVEDLRLIARTHGE